MTTKTIYLRKPYTDVLKVNAIKDSVFRLNLNNGIVYTKSEIYAKIDAIIKQNSDEDELTRIGRWFSSQMNNIHDLRNAEINTANLIQNNNSYSDHLCGGISLVMIEVFRHYFPASQLDIVGGGDVNGGHQWNTFDFGAMDQINKLPFYKDKYIGATFEDLQNDKYLYTEPLKVINQGWHYGQTAYTSYITNSLKYERDINPSPTIDDVYMKMPAGSSFVFPVKSTNIPKLESGANLEMWANSIVTIPINKIGLIEMPFNLLQVTGAGSIVCDAITYNLPTDEAALKIACQTTGYLVEKWIHGFEIISNTDGLVAEFLVNRHKVVLFNKNTVTNEIISGEISIERAKTSIPVPTYCLSVAKNNNSAWSVNFDNYFTANKSLLMPLQFVNWDNRMVYFLPSNNKFSVPRNFQNYIANTTTHLIATTPTIDTCWSSKLMPRTDIFITSLELSFTNIDGSNIYYTIDGTTPDATKTLYIAPFTISATKTVKWINIKTDYANSHVNSRVITKTA